jgi:biotin transport system substrate-specific component
MASSRAPFVTYDSTLLEHVSVGATSAAVWTSIRVASVLFVTTLTAAAAQVSVHLPFTPVPLTLQPIVVLVGAAALGPRLGAASQLLYLGLGAAGFPVFAASAALPHGAARLLGPTGGYLMAYPLAAFITGWLAARGFDRRYLTSTLAMVAGLVTIFAGGVLWLAYFAPGTAGQPTVGLRAALAAGLFPFILPDLVKVSLASTLPPSIWKLMRDS